MLFKALNLLLPRGTVTDWATSHIRTLVPAAVAFLVVYLSSHGIVIPDVTATTGTEQLLGYVFVGYYSTVRFLEAHWPALGWLLGKPGTPSYQPVTAPPASPLSSPYATSGIYVPPSPPKRPWWQQP